MAKKKKAGKPDYELIPPDSKQCQAEKHDRPYSFMTLGPIPPRKRCTNPTTTIAREKKPDRWGRHGEMGLCGDCLAVFVEQQPGVATFKKVKQAVAA